MDRTRHVMNPDVAAALDITVANDPNAHRPVIAAGRRTYTMAQISELYRAGDPFALRFIGGGVERVGAKAFIAELTGTNQ